MVDALPKDGVLKVLNLSSRSVAATMEVNVAPLKWNKDRSLYFYASWRQENGIYIHDKPEEADQCVEWNFATLKGRGVYKGDLLSLYNHAPLWYGEGDEKIWVDDDTFPSHFGTGTEDYYNSSWAPVVPFYTPFGGAPRADLESSHGYNAFYRTRHLMVFLSIRALSSILKCWDGNEVRPIMPLLFIGMAIRRHRYLELQVLKKPAGSCCLLLRLRQTEKHMIVLFKFLIKSNW